MFVFQIFNNYEVTKYLKKNVFFKDKMDTLEFSTTSDYLETILDSSESILVVGPGLSTDYGHYGHPMDFAIIWFLEHLSRESKLTLMDMPGTTYEPSSGCYNLDLVLAYLETLSKIIKACAIEAIRGDVNEIELAENQFGIIWDHGTLDFAKREPKPYSSEPWESRIRKIGKQNRSEAEEETIRSRRMENILGQYNRWLKPNGRAVIFGVDQQRRRFLQAQPNLELRELLVQEDRYATGLTAKQLFPDRAAGDKRDFSDGYLYPIHELKEFFEVRKVN